MTSYSASRFLKSANSTGDFPPDQGREVAFAGRSNAGKSSAINAIVGRHGLARTSKTPGRTQLINFFSLGEHRRLVDLPGYGFARVPVSVKARWERLVEAYFRDRASLAGVMLVVDIRRGIAELDRQMLDWAMDCGCPAHVLLTKADKLKKGQVARALLGAERLLQTLYADSARAPLSLQAFSALKHQGVDDAREVLDGWFQGRPEGSGGN